MDYCVFEFLPFLTYKLNSKKKNVKYDNCRLISLIIKFFFWAD